MFRFRALLAQSARIWSYFWHSGAALRRAAAQINGLLSVGRNRKRPIANRASFGRRWGLPDLAGEPPLMIRRLIVPLTAAIVTVHAGQVLCAGRVSGAVAQPEPHLQMLRRFRR